MKFPNTCILFAVCCRVCVASAQLQLVPDQEPLKLFGGARTIRVVWHNAGDKSVATEIRARLYQAGSATAVPLAETLWKHLQVLPQQTVLESARGDFPSVSAETKVVVRWLEDSNHVLGITEALVYPTNLLEELKPLLGDDQLGVLDPTDKLKPLLKQNHVEFLDLGEMSLEDFRGKLAVLGPFESKTQMRENFAQSVRKIASKGVAVVWVQPPPLPKDEIKPSYYTMPVSGAVVVVMSDLIANFAENPQSQLNLVSICKLALKPKPPALPFLNVQ